MRVVLLPIFFLFVAPLALARGGGDSINNGGGAAEQAVVYSAKQFRPFLQSCAKYSNCGAADPNRSQLAPLLRCDFPGEKSIRFATAKENEALRDGSERGLPFAVSAERTLLLNRGYLYSDRNEPLSIPGAMGFISRVYLELCGGLAFPQSSALARTLSAFAEFDSEQVTIGKDDLDLPYAEWIRVRTLYSDLVVESVEGLLRLSCPGGELALCSLVKSEEVPSPARFSNLSLAWEKKSGAVVSFRVEGWISVASGPESFALTAEFAKGKVQRLALNGRELELPRSKVQL